MRSSNREPLERRPIGVGAGTSHVLPALQASAAAALDGLLVSPKAREEVG